MSFKKDIVPQAGDLLRVRRRIKGVETYFHYGIAIDSKTVVHFTAPNSDLGEDGEEKTIIISSLDRFLLGDKLQVQSPYESPFKPEEVVERARSYIDSHLFRNRKYNFIKNNCEHFANFIYYGKCFCNQVRAFATGVAAGAVAILGGPIGTGAVAATAIVSSNKKKKKNLTR